MALVPCPECGRRISTAALACPRCGYPMASAPPTAPAPLPPPSTDATALFGTAAVAPGRIAVPALHGGAVTSELRCTACGSDNVRRLAIIYREGMAVLNARMGGVGAGGGGLAVGGAATVGTQQSLASMGAAPPEKMSVKGAAALLAAGAVLFLASLGAGAVPGAVGGLVVAAGGLLWVQRVRAYNQVRFPELYREWENTFTCRRCAHTFVWEAGAG
ncbi:MAG TPA: hypothetical protein VF263_14705 [Longimicrobiaceae bacterium]